jgi:aspartokinase
MFRVLVVIVLVLFPLISRAEEQAKKGEQVVVVVSVDKRSGELKVSIVKQAQAEESIVEHKHRRRAK